MNPPSPPAAPAFAGYVLCGGASRRMGRDKAALEVDGRPMADRVVEALRDAGAAAVATVGGRHRPPGTVRIADRWPGEGPLGGVITALAHAGPDARVAVLSCDLLDPSPAAVASLVDIHAASGADVVVPVVSGRRQWLHAVWSSRVAGILADLFAAGERSVAGALTSLRVELVADVPAPAVADADVPADLARRPTIASVEIPAIDITGLREQLDAGHPVFDVREPDEYVEAHAPGVRLVPLGEVADRVGEYPAYRLFAG